MKQDYNFANSKALFVLRIITMSFAIITCVVIMTALLTRWISDINRAVKESKTQIARAAARLNKYKKGRIKHILKLRRLQLKEEKESRRYNKKHGISDDEADANELENELDDLSDLSLELEDL